MSSVSLRDIERTMRALWMDRAVRERFAHGSTKSSLRTILDEMPQDLLAEIDPKGVRLYANLLRYGHVDVMSSIYPGCEHFIGEDKWDRVVEDYVTKHPPKDYNLNKLAQHFPEFLSRYADRYVKNCPFLPELADYEWIEMELLEDNTKIEVYLFQPLTCPEQLESSKPVVNPVVSLRRYSYPITEIVEHLQDGCCIPRNIDKKECMVAVYRDPHTHKCRFLELGKVSMQLVEAALKQEMSYKDLLALTVSLIGGGNPQRAAQEFLELIERFQSAHLFVGSI